MSWQKMRIPGGAGGQGESLPGDRGRYLLWLEAPHVEGEGHFVHFSWKEDSFCIRDYIRQAERRQDGATSAIDIWKVASDRIPAKGELYVPVENFEFWTAKLTELTNGRNRGTNSSLWSRLSSKFAPKSQQAGGGDRSEDPIATEPGLPVKNSDRDNNLDVYHRFIATWSKAAGFHVIERTVGCSARYESEPLLWVYPTYFQIAPQGKGNVRYGEVSDIRDRHFPEFRGKGMVRFDSEHFTWDRFQSFIAEVQRMVRSA